MHLLVLLALATVQGQRARIDVDGEVSAKQQKQVVALVEAVVADVERRFTQKAKTPDEHVKLLIYSNEDRYRTEAAKLGPVISDWGFYMPDKRTAIANVGASIGNLRHELVHPLIGDDYPAIPVWLNEGIASLYGSAKLGKHGFTFLVNYRLRDLQKALKANTLPSLSDLANSTEDDVHGDRAMVFYAYARYVLFYVDQKGKLSELYAELRGADRKQHAAILAKYVDEQSFRAWARKLRY
jgi:hypothetical protein